jgi:Lipase (class 3)
VDVTRAVQSIQFGQLVDQAGKIAPDDLTNRAGTALSVGSTKYTVVTTVYANDLATDMDSSRDNVAIGLICQQDTTGDVVVAIRGTQGIWEWIHDINFFLVPCPFLAAGGHTEDGFTDMYQSLRTDVAGGSTTFVEEIGNLAFPQPVRLVTACGHSLGGALATLLALDLTANGKAPFNQPAVYTYGSPRTGDSSFAATYNQAVMNSYRIANRLDIVPQLPPSPLYQHVAAPDELTPIQLLPLPPKVLVEESLPCEHSLNTYLYLLSLQSGGPVIPLDAACQP